MENCVVAFSHNENVGLKMLLATLFNTVLLDLGPQLVAPPIVARYLLILNQTISLTERFCQFLLICFPNFDYFLIFHLPDLPTGCVTPCEVCSVL
jgi:hypothetical protein